MKDKSKGKGKNKKLKSDAGSKSDLNNKAGLNGRAGVFDFEKVTKKDASPQKEDSAEEKIKAVAQSLQSGTKSQLSDNSEEDPDATKLLPYKVVYKDKEEPFSREKLAALISEDEKADEEKKHTAHPHRKKNDKWDKGFIAVIVVLLLVIFAVGGFLMGGGLLAKKDKNDETGEDGRLKKPDLLIAKDKAVILILGVDTREDDIGRSDTLMVAAVDPKLKQVSLLSIPRDTRVYIERYGYDKINVAYPLGGVKLTKATVQDFLGTPIDHYVLVNKQMFKRGIDAIGGVDIDVEMRMEYEDPWDDEGLVIDLKPGMQHLDGAKAIGYVRYRDEEGDIGRVKRQQKFIAALIKKVADPEIITQVPEVVGIVYHSLETDMSMRQMAELIGAVYEARDSGFKSDLVPGEPFDDPESGINYWLPSITMTRELVASVLGVKMTPEAKRAMDADAAEYAASYERLQSKAATADDDEKDEEKDKSERLRKARGKEGNERSTEKSSDIRESKVSDGGKEKAADKRQPNKSAIRNKKDAMQSGVKNSGTVKNKNNAGPNGNAKNSNSSTTSNIKNGGTATKPNPPAQNSPTKVAPGAVPSGGGKKM